MSQAQGTLYRIQSKLVKLGSFYQEGIGKYIKTLFKIYVCSQGNHKGKN